MYMLDPMNATRSHRSEIPERHTAPHVRIKQTKCVLSAVYAVRPTQVLCAQEAATRIRGHCRYSRYYIPPGACGSDADVLGIPVL